MLKALELVGFKSFADRTRFDFPPGITAVVGPNGSGKSNVVDAIKWVLGEQSVKSLRGKEMADVIFNGSSTRSPLNFAETTLTLDNRSRRLPIDTAEVLVTRRVYRNGEGEYLLNRQPCRLRDIRELFSGTGVATEAYSVIEQGKVDVLLQSSPRDRRLIFEEAAGISRFKAKKIESQRRLERVEQNLLRLGDIVGEVEHRLRQVRLQATKARRYQEYTARLQELRTHVGLVDWRAASARLAAMDEELAAFATQRAAAHERGQQCDLAAQEVESGLGATADKLLTSEARLGQVRAGIATREAAIAHEQRRGAELEKEASRLRRQLAAVSVRVGGLQQQLADTAGLRTAAESAHSRAAEEASASDAVLASVGGKFTAQRRAADESRHAYLTEMRRAAQWESEASNLGAQLAAADSSQKQHQDKLSELAATVDALQSEIADSEQQEQVLAAALDEQRSREAKIRSEVNELSDRQRRGDEEIAVARQNLAAARERAKVLEEFERRQEGYSEAVKQVLAQARSKSPGPFRHVRGVVAELLQVSVEMAPLVEAALGERAGHLVVSSLDETLLALDIDPQRLAGQVTFTPIETRSSRAAPGPEVDLHGRPGIVARADELVRASPHFVPLAVRLLGSTWIVDTLHRATELSRAHQGMTFVATSGEVVSPTGEISYGPCSPVAGLISRRSELQALVAQTGELEAKIERQSAELTAIAADSAAAQKSLAESGREQARVAADLSEQRARGKGARDRSRRAVDEQQREGVALAAAGQIIATASRGKQTAEERLAASRLALAEHERAAATLGEQMAQLDRERSAAETTATAAKLELGKCEERLANLRLRERQLEQDQRERQTTVADVDHELTQCIARLNESSRARLAAESELALLYLDKEQTAALTVGLVVEQDAHRARRSELLAETQRLAGQTREIEERMHAHELATSEVRHARNALADRLREDYQIELATIDQESSSEVAAAREEIETEIAELRRKIAHIGNVNLDALGELDELESRYTHLSGQHRDLTAAKQSLVQIIERINTDSRRLFAETLEQVRTNFRTLFRKMFGGGQADIVIEEGADVLESGIEIVARPPGKEPRNISLLSGGEKTLTCVALLLAIFQCRPSPFCVLDEVDAALDEANIERFIGVLQEFLAWTQFIVITHSKKTMTCATTLYGVTMQESGVSKRVSVRFEDISSHHELPADAGDSVPDEMPRTSSAASDDSMAGETEAA